MGPTGPFCGEEEGRITAFGDTTDMQKGPYHPRHAPRLWMAFHILSLESRFAEKYYVLILLFGGGDDCNCNRRTSAPPPLAEPSATGAVSSPSPGELADTERIRRRSAGRWVSVSAVGLEPGPSALASLFCEILLTHMIHIKMFLNFSLNTVKILFNFF